MGDLIVFSFLAGCGPLVPPNSDGVLVKVQSLSLLSSLAFPSHDPSRTTLRGGGGAAKTAKHAFRTPCSRPPSSPISKSYLLLLLHAQSLTHTYILPSSPPIPLSASPPRSFRHMPSSSHARPPRHPSLPHASVFFSRFRLTPFNVLNETTPGRPVHPGRYWLFPF